MKKRAAVTVLILLLGTGSLAYGFGGRFGDGPCLRGARQDLLSQLPADKEMLFHQTMREAREKTGELREQIMALRAELKEILTGPKFDADRFLAKTAEIQALHARMREVMEEAIVTLAGRFTQEEREILVQLIPPGPAHGGPAGIR